MNFLLSQLWRTRHFCLKNMHEKLTKCPNFTRYFPKCILSRFFSGEPNKTCPCLLRLYFCYYSFSSLLLEAIYSATGKLVNTG